MASNNSGESYFRLTELPERLILETVLWAQRLWLEEWFCPQAPFAGVNRYAPRRISSASDGGSSCCRGQDWAGRRPRCLRITKLVPLRLQSPARRLSHTGRAMRTILTSDGDLTETIWSLDNVIFPRVAKLSQVETAEHGALQRAANNLIAVNVCACPISSSVASYSDLERIKLAIPWPEHHVRPGDQPAYDPAHSFFYLHPGRAGGALRHVDVEIYDRAPHAVKYGARRVVGVLSEGLQGSRVGGLDVYYYSPQLTSLCIYFSLAWEVEFTSDLSMALQACAGNLCYLTIDAGGGTFAELDRVSLPTLRFLRLVFPQGKVGRLLRRLDLPHDVDMHLEPVVRWREHVAEAPAENALYEAPIWRSDLLQECTADGGSLGDYVKTLAAPDNAVRLFSAPPGLLTRGLTLAADYELWMSLCAIGLDIRLGEKTAPTVHVASRFPEYISVSLARSRSELDAVMKDPVARDWQNSGARDETRTARRSLSVRDGQFAEATRRRYENDRYPKALYDAVTYVIRAVLADRTNDHTALQYVTFGRDSWLPDRSLGYAHILGEFWGLRAIHFASPPLVPETPFKQGGEGCLAIDHMEALALYLNTPREANLYPCSRLERISFPAACTASLPAMGDLEQLFNSPERYAYSGAPWIVVGPDLPN
ncbi:unnamed protein product [Peniophora sp. CBMAI 1063]|nr:unnamed protein product [Peniophora sp. CBMAI 1063]